MGLTGFKWSWKAYLPRPVGQAPTLRPTLLLGGHRRLGEGAQFLAQARLVLLRVIDLPLEEDDLAAPALEPERDFQQVIEPVDDRRVGLRRRKDEQEAAAARAEQLAAVGAGL